MRVVILTLDRHRRAACEAAQRRLAREAPGIVLTMLGRSTRVDIGDFPDSPPRFYGGES